MTTNAESMDPPVLCTEAQAGASGSTASGNACLTSNGPRHIRGSRLLLVSLESITSCPCEVVKVCEIPNLLGNTGNSGYHSQITMYSLTKRHEVDRFCCDENMSTYIFF